MTLGASPAIRLRWFPKQMKCCLFLLLYFFKLTAEVNCIGDFMESGEESFLERPEAHRCVSHESPHTREGQRDPVRLIR